MQRGAGHAEPIKKKQKIKGGGTHWTCLALLNTKKPFFSN